MQQITNCRQETLSRPGVTHVVLKYAERERVKNTKLIPGKIFCHLFRHFKAMHLLKAGIYLVYLLDIPGHAFIGSREQFGRGGHFLLVWTSGVKLIVFFHK